MKLCAHFEKLKKTAIVGIVILSAALAVFLAAHRHGPSQPVFLSPQDNTTNSGILSVTTSFTSLYPIKSVDLFFDGEEMGITTNGHGASGWTIDTAEHANGSHILEARYLTRRLGTPVYFSAVLTNLITSNPLAENITPRAGFTAGLGAMTFAFDTSMPALLNLYVYDSTGTNLLWYTSGTNTAPGTFTTYWNLQDNNGNPVSFSGQDQVNITVTATPLQEGDIRRMDALPPLSRRFLVNVSSDTYAGDIATTARLTSRPGTTNHEQAVPVLRATQKPRDFSPGGLSHVRVIPDNKNVPVEPVERAVNAMIANAHEAGLIFEPHGNGVAHNVGPVNTVNKITSIRTDDTIFHVLSSPNNDFAPGVDHMQLYGKDENGAPLGYNSMMSASATFLAHASFLYADTNFYPVVSGVNDVSNAVDRFVKLQFPEGDYARVFAGKRGLGQRMPFLEFKYAATSKDDPLAQFKVNNTDNVKVVVRVGGKDLKPGQAVLVGYEAMGVRRHGMKTSP
jgi:hypothetical protein